MEETREFEILGRRRGAIMSRLYVPTGASGSSPGLLYLHGGGWVIGSSDAHDRLARELAVAIGARVVLMACPSPRSSHTPEGLDDCVDAAQWLATHGGEIGT